jgi:hypothetical protein
MPNVMCKIKKYVLIMYIAFIGFYANAQKVSDVYVPYFGKMTSIEVCGMPKCKPGAGAKWASIKDALFYEGEAGSILGRYYIKSIFETSPCVRVAPKEQDIIITGRSVLNGKVEEDKKRNFDAQLSADLARIIDALGNMPAEVKADLQAQVRNSVTSETANNIDLEYKVIQLKNDYISSQVAACFGNLPKKSKVILGIGLITVNGSWTSNTLQKAFRNFEANSSAYKALSAEAKADYEKNKNRALSGNFDAFPLIISASYNYKEK